MTNYRALCLDMNKNLRRSVLKKMIKLLKSEDHTEVEAGAKDAHSTKQQSSVTTVTNLDISYMNV